MKINMKIDLKIIVDEVIKDYSDIVERYVNGETGLLGMLVGEAMKRSKGLVNPKELNEAMLSALDVCTNIVKRWTVNYYYDPISKFCFLNPKNKSKFIEHSVKVVTIKHENNYTSFLDDANEQGGPVMSASTVNESMDKFKEAWSMFVLIKSFASHDPSIFEKMLNVETDI